MDAARAISEDTQLQRFARAVELPLALLALLIVPAIVLENHAQSAALRNVALAINWLVWLAFCGEYAVKLYLSPARWRFAKDHWFDLLIVVLSPPIAPTVLRGTRSLRMFRLLRFIRGAAVAAMGLRMARDALRHRRFHYVLLATAAIVTVGAIAIFTLEQGTNRSIETIDDAFWWAIVTTTTVGYGDVSPVTGEGRVVAVLLMLLGIGFIGALTATITSFFFDHERDARGEELEVRLATIEEKLDRLLAERSLQSPARAEAKAPLEESAKSS